MFDLIEKWNKSCDNHEKGLRPDRYKAVTQLVTNGCMHQGE